MKKVFILFVISVLVTLFLACEEENIVGINNPNGVFEGSITFMDTAGTNLWKGTIKINRNNKSDLSGSWKYENGESGNLEGIIDSNTIRINMHPNMIDNNTFLNGKLYGNKIEGKWSHSGVMGVIRYGKFICESFK